MIDTHTERLLKARDRADHVLDEIEQLRSERETEPYPDVSEVLRFPDRSLGAQMLSALQRGDEYSPRESGGVEVQDTRLDRSIVGSLLGSWVGSCLGGAAGPLLKRLKNQQRQHYEQWLRDQFSRPEDHRGLSAYLQGYEDGFKAANEDDGGDCPEGGS